MAKRKLKEAREEEWLRLANERYELPAGDVWLEYQPDVDLLWIGFEEHPSPTHSDDDQERGLIFNYQGNKLVSVEILDLYGIFVS